MPTASAFGRTRAGRSTWPPALASGAVLSALVAGAAALLKPGPDAWLLATLVFVFTLPVTTMGGWVVVVDRNTVRGATPRPEESIESAWLQRAGFGACFDLIALGGLATAAFSLVPALGSVPAWAALGGLTLVAMSDVWVRYLVLSRRTA